MNTSRWMALLAVASLLIVAPWLLPRRTTKPGPGHEASGQDAPTKTSGIHRSAAAMDRQRPSPWPQQGAAGAMAAPPHGPMLLHEAVAAWPPSHAEATAAIQEFAQAIGLSDAILVDPSASDDVILDHARDLGVPESFATSHLPDVFTVHDSLAAHLERALWNPELGHLRDVLAAIGVPVQLGTDLLVDAFRLGAFHASFGDFMLQLAHTTVPEGRTPLACDIEEIQRCLRVREEALRVVDAFFVDRFVGRHGLSRELAEQVVQAVGGLQVRTAAPPVMGVPRVRKP